MAMSAVPYALQDVTHNANLFRQATASLVPVAGGIVTAGDFNVTQTATPSMAVIVGVGRIWIPGSEIANVSGGNFSSQSLYYAQNESADTRTVMPADPSNPRIDMVYAYVKDQAYSGSQNLADYAIQQGAATPGASYPANAPSLPNNSIALAWIYVGAGASSILNANITSLTGAALRDTRRHAEYTGPVVGSSPGAGANFGQMTVDNSVTFNNTFVQPAGTTGLKILESGVYLLTEIGLPSSNGTQAQLWATRSGSTSDNLISMNYAFYGGNTVIGSAVFYGVVNDIIQCGITTSGSTTTGSRIKLTKLQGF